MPFEICITKIFFSSALHLTYTISISIKSNNVYKITNTTGNCSRTCLGAGGNCLPKFPTFGRNHNFSGNDKEIFGQNRNFSGSDKKNLGKSRI